ncbi:ion transporter, partial [bacterium]|nr:ion transporter [bacterium]
MLVVFGLVGLLNIMPGAGSSRALRAIRALRPLRMMSKSGGLKSVISLLFGAVPAIAAVVSSMLFYWLIFAIIGVGLFKGSFYRCQTEDGNDSLRSLTQPQQYLITDPAPYSVNITYLQSKALNATAATTVLVSVIAQQSMTNANGTCGGYKNAAGADMPCWEFYKRDYDKSAPTSKVICQYLQHSGHPVLWEKYVSANFDHVGFAMLALVEVATLEGWVEVLYATMDATGVDMHPKRNYAQGASLYLIGFIIFGVYFLMNLFVSVFIDHVQEMRKEIGGKSLFLSEVQEKFLNAEEMLLGLDFASDDMIGMNLGLRKTAKNILGKEDSVFNRGMQVCIVINTICMMCYHLHMSKQYFHILETIDTVLASLFVFEAVLKITAMGPRSYLHSEWNRFDLFLAVAFLMEKAFKGLLPIGVGPIRSLRLFRMVRLVRHSTGIRALCNTFIVTLPAVGNVALIQALIICIYAILGVQLFAKVQLEEPLSDRFNFQNFGNALLTLIVCATGEKWNTVMYALARDSEDCDSNPNYYDPSACGFTSAENCTEIKGCGSSIAYLYFFSFILLVYFVLLNLFVTVLLEGFERCEVIG